MSKSLNLNAVEWGEFRISNIFEVFTGAIIRQNELIKGKIPRITATDANNGVAFFTQETLQHNFKKFKNVISISFLGSVFYQPSEVSLDMKIHGLKIKDKELKVHIALFLIPLIKKLSFKYAYGYQLLTSILKMQKLKLPIDSQGQPKLRLYGIHIEQEQLSKVLAYYTHTQI